MGGSRYEKAAKNITVKVEKRLGKVIDSFAIRTGRKHSDAIVKEAKKAIKSHLRHLS
jgi:hypothetical protein